jgi:hypothetical protein
VIILESKKNIFRKAQIIESKKYIHRRDLLNMLLEDSKTYSLDEVDKLIKKFEKEKVN